MTTIAIQSNVKLQFPPASFGYVKMEIDLIQNKPIEKVYEVRIIDTCFDKIFEKQLKKDYIPKFVDENSTILSEPLSSDYEEVEVINIMATSTRFKKFSYEELKQLAAFVSVDFSDSNIVIDNINTLFKKGLITITQMECQKGISGKGRGMYFSEVQDWNLIQD